MSRKLTPQEFEKIDSFVNNAISARTKKDAESYMTQLNSFQRTVAYDVFPNVRYMLSELISSTESASGQVREKEHWVTVTKSLLYKLNSFGVGEGESDE